VDPIVIPQRLTRVDYARKRTPVLSGVRELVTALPPAAFGLWREMAREGTPTLGDLLVAGGGLALAGWVLGALGQWVWNWIRAQGEQNQIELAAFRAREQRITQNRRQAYAALAAALDLGIQLLGEQPTDVVSNVIWRPRYDAFRNGLERSLGPHLTAHELDRVLRLTYEVRNFGRHNLDGHDERLTALHLTLDTLRKLMEEYADAAPSPPAARVLSV
jgi:hypothetical protein